LAKNSRFIRVAERLKAAERLSEQMIFRDRFVLDASASGPFEVFAQLQALMCHPLSDRKSAGAQRMASALT
jgi:hypothetical protein